MKRAIKQVLQTQRCEPWLLHHNRRQTQYILISLVCLLLPSAQCLVSFFPIVTMFRRMLFRFAPAASPDDIYQNLLSVFKCHFLSKKEEMLLKYETMQSKDRLYDVVFLYIFYLETFILAKAVAPVLFSEKTSLEPNHEWCITETGYHRLQPWTRGTNQAISCFGFPGEV